MSVWSLSDVLPGAQPLLYVIAEHRANIEQHEQSAHHSQSQHRSFRRTGLRYSHCFIWKQEHYVVEEGRGSVNRRLPLPNSALVGSLFKNSDCFSSPKSSTRISWLRVISSSFSSSSVELFTDLFLLPHDSNESRPHSHTAYKEAETRNIIAFALNNFLVSMYLKVQHREYPPQQCWTHKYIPIQLS